MNPFTTSEEIAARRKAYEARMSSATRRILEVSTELHLTWEEFEDVLGRLKGRAYICAKPCELENSEQPHCT